MDKKKIVKLALMGLAVGTAVCGCSSQPAGSGSDNGSGKEQKDKMDPNRETAPKAPSGSGCCGK